MGFGYYNQDNDPEGSFAKKYGGWKKRKLFTIWFTWRFLEMIQFENSDRGYLLWITTPETIRVFGLWSNDEKASGSKKFYQTWHNDHVGC